MRRGGTADLPLHVGRVPKWLSERMARLGRGITIAIVEEYGTEGFLSRLSDPFWFQAFGAVLGMDWHSSGITTSVMGALKRGINPIAYDLGLFVCGGRGKASRKTPDELTEVAMTTGLNGTELVHASKLSAKVDNTCLQDGFQLYLHSFVVDRNGRWSVVQQGMNNDNGMARRYHWNSAEVTSFVSDPHSAVIGQNFGELLNLSDGRAEKARNSIVDFLGNPVSTQLTELRHLTMAKPHQITPDLVNSKRLGAVLALAHEQQFKQFADAIMIPGVGPRTLQALALVSEVIYGEPTRFDDPARFAFAHGGKDGARFPVPTKVYDENIQLLNSAVHRARLDQSDKLAAYKKIHGLSLLIEQQCEPHADVNRVIEHEWKNSHRYGGRTVKGAVKPPKPKPPIEGEQLSFL